MKKSQISLKWLEVFNITARTGSVQATADEAGLSVSTVSHHLSRLEETLGVHLFDHSRRPMRITPTGIVYQKRIDEALRLIKKAEIEVQACALGELQNLTLAVIEDFDSEIAPELARVLTTNLPKNELRILTRPSHEILQLLQEQKIDIGIATRPQFDHPDLIEYPLVRDPFVMAVPARLTHAPEHYLNGSSGLPLLRYSQDQIIGAQIAAQLRRLRISVPQQLEFESNQTIMSMVAAGDGWAITTATNFIRAGRFQRQAELVPFPEKGFARFISLFTTSLHSTSAAETVANTMRQLIQTHAINPAVKQRPWLESSFRMPTSPEVRSEF